MPGRFRAHGRDAHATSSADFTSSYTREIGLLVEEGPDIAGAIAAKEPMRPPLLTGLFPGAVASTFRGSDFGGFTDGGAVTREALGLEVLEVRMLEDG